MGAMEMKTEERTGLSRRSLMGKAAAVAAFTVVPRHVSGRGGQCAAEREAQYRRDRDRRTGRGRPGRVPQREYRRLVRCGRGVRRARLQEVPQGEEVDGLPQDARRAEGHRRGRDRRAGPSARGRRDGRDQAGQARLLREAPGPLYLGVPAAHPGRPRGEGRDAAWQPGPGLGKQPPGLRDHLGRRARHGSGGACVVQSAHLAARD